MQLFVGGEELFVGGLELAVDGLETLDGGAQVALRILKFVLEIGNAPRGGGVDVVFFDGAVGVHGLVLAEEDGEEALGFFLGRILDGLNDEIDGLAAARRVADDVGVGDGAAFAAGAADGCGCDEGEILVEHVEKVQRGAAWGEAEVVGVIAEEMHDAVVLAQDDGRWQKALEEVGVEALGGAVVVLVGGLQGAAAGDGLDVWNVEGRRGEVVDFAVALVDVDLLGVADGLEEVDVFAGGLALAEEEEAVLLEGGVEDGEKPAPQHWLEIDHDVAAADEIELAERRIGEHVVSGEDDHAADLLGDLVLVAALDEKFRQPVGGDVVDDVFRENAATGLLDGAAVDVGGEDLDIALEIELLHGLAEEDGDGIGFLAGGAAGAPDADGLVLLGALEDLVNGVVLELFKEIGIAEEIRDANEDLLDEDVHLLGVVAEKLGKFAEGLGVGDEHAAFDAAQDGGALVVGEIDAAGVFQDGVDVGEGFLVRKGGFVFRRAQEHRCVREIEDLLGDLLRRQHKIRQAGVDDALGHAVKAGAFRHLGDDEAVVLLHGLDAAGAVAPCAGKNDGDGVFLVLLGHRVEEDVDRVVQRAGHIFRQDEAAVLHGHVFLRRDQIHGVALDGHAVFCLVDAHVGVLAEDIRHQALVIRRQMLHDDEAQAAVGRHVVEKLLQRLQPASRRTDADDDRRQLMLRVDGGHFFVCGNHEWVSFPM